MKRQLPIFILLGCAALFAFGLVELFQLRFAGGDVFPPYSSLRADPLGSMALYESLGKISGVTVRRDFSDNNQLPETSRTVYLQLAGSPYDWDWLPDDLHHEIQNFLARGNRLVITFFPQTEAYDSFYDDADETNSVDATNSVSGKTKSEKMPPPKRHKKKKKNADDDGYVSLADEWGFHSDFRSLPSDGDTYAPVVVTNKTDLPLPPTLAWHSGVVFTNWDNAWHVIYARGKNAVVLERQIDHGSVVLATDSYFASNEALSKDRHADLLAWLIGDNDTVVFDESHFGIVDTGGVATLMRQYRLHGFAAGLLLLAGLFIWKNSTSLVPPPADAEQFRFIAGKDSASGFVNLLRRNLAPRDLLATCFAEWKKSAAAKTSPARAQQAEAIFQAENARPAKDRNPTDAYRKISEVLQNKKL